MINRGALVWMILAITAGTGLFLLKYEVRAMEEHLVQIEKQTQKNLESVHVLKAEWSHMNQPARLEDLGRRLLLLEPVMAEQTASIAEIPMRPVSVRRTAASKHQNTSDLKFPEISPAVGLGPPLFATYRRVQ